MPGFEEWESFYVIVGAAAGALIGLQFVVMTLMADRPPAPGGGAAYAKPQVAPFTPGVFSPGPGARAMARPRPRRGAVGPPGGVRVRLPADSDRPHAQAERLST